MDKVNYCKIETEQKENRLEVIEENILKIKNNLENFASEITEIKSNLVLISEIISKLSSVDDMTDIRSRNNYKVFGKFVEDTLDNLEKTQAESAVLEIVEILHKYKTKCIA